ncbi:MAG: Asp-tRNA(Asn)/Glu-tRNA(Gln) amidotransferase subunit GatC [Patescibacteria group bacterium]|nr:Asp-tRNA(Asn)/Glu-tRNA(Gln) amidotransferase subunit GatC [Patescibacteria group bacterium]
MINISDIAKLARLELSLDEKKELGKEISAVLDYFEKIKKADVSGVDIKQSVFLARNITREDKAEAQSDEVVENLVQAIPNKEKRNAKVKAIL